MITEQNLIDLGFEKVEGNLEGQTEPWYYYNLDIDNVNLTSDDSDMVKDEHWNVHVWELDLVINNMSNLNGFINIITRIIRDNK
jgi:hypothetical protein